MQLMVELVDPSVILHRSDELVYFVRVKHFKRLTFVGVLVYS